jgi:hypothetical protein
MYLFLGLPSDLFPSGIPTKMRVGYIYHLPACVLIVPRFSSLIYVRNFVTALV